MSHLGVEHMPVRGILMWLLRERQPVAELDSDGFAVALVPHTLAATTLGALEPGRPVNLEADVLAKYVERLCFRAPNEMSS